MWYKNIVKNFKLFLVGFPIWFFIVIISELFDKWDWSKTPTERTLQLIREDIKLIFYMFIWLYIIGIIFFALVFIFYTNILWFNKLIYHIKQYIKKTKIKLRIYKKRIWKNPIIIQYTPPKNISPMECSYLYNMKRHKGNISCLLYKWATEKRIKMQFIEQKFPQKDTIKITVINKNIEWMTEEEQYARELLIDKQKEIEIPSKEVMKKIPLININTAKNCLKKGLIEKWYQFTMTKAKRNIINIAITFFFVLGNVLSIAFWILKNNDPTLLISKFTIYLPATLGIIIVFSAIAWSIIVDDKYDKNTKYVRYKPSKKWEAVLAEIYGYKYFLEACDEKVIKVLLEKDPLYIDKMIPYAVALETQTLLVENIAPSLFEWTDNSWFIWGINKAAQTFEKEL